MFVDLFIEASSKDDRWPAEIVVFLSMYETYYQLSKLFAPTYEKSGNSVINHGTSLGEGTVEKTGVMDR